MSVTLSLSSQGSVKAYLARKAFDFPAPKGKLAAETATLAVHKAELVAATAEYNLECERLKTAKAALKQKWESLHKKFLDDFCKQDYTGYWLGTHVVLDPNRKDFNPAKVTAHEAVEEAKKAFERCASYASTSVKYEAANKVSQAETRIASMKRAHEAAAAQIDSTRSALPTGAADLSDDQLRAMADYKVPSDLDLSWPDVTQAVALGMIRGEIDLDCTSCTSGYEIVVINDDLVVVLDDEVRHPTCAAHDRWDPDDLDGLISPAFAHHRVHSLNTWVKSPISLDRQEKLISKLPSDSDDVRGWLMVGPAGSSKTTYAAASITDMLTARLANGVPRNYLNFFQVKVPNWVREMEAWDTRDFGDDRIDPPSLTPNFIGESTRGTGISPILWLEELDKLKPTQPRINYLFRLMDAVYEVGGTIIATTNDTLPELRKRLGDPVYRRLSGVNDDPAKFWVLDLYETNKAKVKG